MKIKRFSKTGERERDDLKVGDKISLGAIRINNALTSKKDKELLKNILKSDSTEEDYDKIIKNIFNVCIIDMTQSLSKNVKKHHKNVSKNVMLHT